MKKFIIGNKIGMTQVFDSEGEIIPVTAIKVDTCKILKLIEKEKQGYDALLIGYQIKKDNKCSKALKGAFNKIGAKPMKYLKEIRVNNIVEYKVSEDIKVNIFEEKELVDVRSKSIGKGFAGTIKRHGFSRGPESHGSKNCRLPGSIGGGTDPGKVFKGQKMPGHCGNTNVTIKNLTIVGIDNENQVIFLKGAVPGKKNTIVEIFNK
jgi:large subunit ribosomal protein L3